MIVDFIFRTQGRELAIDHGYPLYGAITTVVPELHANPFFGIHPIGGIVIDKRSRRMSLTSSSHLRVRAPIEMAPSIIKISGKRLQIGKDHLNIGIPEIHPLPSVGSLQARLVTFKNAMTEDTHYSHCLRTLEQLGVNGEIQTGNRRTIRIAGKEIIGYQVSINKLSSEDSLTIQSIGIGGRRTMGCGLFHPLGEGRR